MAAGGSDFCLTSVTHYLAARARSGPLAARFVAVVVQRSPIAGIVAAGSTPARPADLGGRRLGGPADSRLVAEYQAALGHLGLAPSVLVPTDYGAAPAARARRGRRRGRLRRPGAPHPPPGGGGGPGRAAARRRLRQRPGGGRPPSRRPRGPHGRGGGRSAGAPAPRPPGGPSRAAPPLLRRRSRRRPRGMGAGGAEHLRRAGAGVDGCHPLGGDTAFLTEAHRFPPVEPETVWRAEPAGVPSSR